MVVPRRKPRITHSVNRIELDETDYGEGLNLCFDVCGGDFGVVTTRQRTELFGATNEPPFVVRFEDHADPEAVADVREGTFSAQTPSMGSNFVIF